MLTRSTIVKLSGISVREYPVLPIALSIATNMVESTKVFSTSVEEPISYFHSYVLMIFLFTIPSGIPPEASTSRFQIERFHVFGD